MHGQWQRCYDSAFMRYLFIYYYYYYYYSKLFLVLLAIVGHADLSADNVEDVLKWHCESLKMRGIRHMLNHHPTKPIYSEQKHDNFLTDPKWLAGVGLLEKYNLSFEFHVLPHQMKRSADVARKFPGVMFMVDHCGIPYERDDAKIAELKDGNLR